MVTAGGGSAVGPQPGSAGIDVTRENSTKRSSGHHLGSSFSIICVMGALPIVFATCGPAARRPAAESGGGVAGVEPPAAHRYRSSADLRVRFGGRPGSVVLEGRRRRGPGGRPIKVLAVEDLRAIPLRVRAIFSETSSHLTCILQYSTCIN